MSRIEQLNTCTRFIIYFILLLMLFGVGKEFQILLLVSIIIIIIFYNLYIQDPLGIQNDLLEEVKSNEKFSQSNQDSACSNCNENFDLNKPMVTLYDSVKNKIFKGNSKPNVNFQVESGYIDSDGNYKIGPNYSDINYSEYSAKKQKDEKKKVSWEKDQLYKKDNGRKPTVNNPYANIVFSDYLDAGNIAEPCNVDNSDIQTEMQNLYNSSIYRNLSDVWERENSQRMFYTMPIQTVPNSQTDFANWLYKTGPTCHENTQYCTYYQDPSMTSPRY